MVSRYFTESNRWNTQALSNADIVEMLTKSSSAMAEANNSLEETVALETAAFRAEYTEMYIEEHI